MSYFSNTAVFKGVIVFNDMDKLISLYNEKSEEYFDYLKEDLYQVVYEKEMLLLDIGWYNSGLENQGSFNIQLIKDYDWERSISKETSKDISGIEDIVAKIISKYNL